MMDARELALRCEHLEFCLKELTEPDPTMELPTELYAMKTPLVRILGALLKAKGRTLSTGALMAAMYFDRPEADWPELHIVQVHMCHLRKTLREVGSEIKIVSIWGRGYRAIHG